MGTILASTLIDAASSQLRDKNNIEWSRTEWLQWLNYAQRAIVAAQPAANSTIATVALAAGSRQTIPAAGFMLLDVFCNMGLTPGTTPGRAIRLTSRAQLDAIAPTWRSATANVVARHYMTDPQDQTAFYVYPQSPGTNYVQIAYAAVPTKITAEGTAIGISDIYEPALLDYMMYRACLKIGSAGRQPDPIYASNCWNTFVAAVGNKATAEAANNPNLGLLPQVVVEAPGGST